MKIGRVLDTLNSIMAKESNLSNSEASILLETVLDTLVEVGNGVTDETLHEAADQLFKFRDFWFEHTVGPNGIPGDLGPGNCSKGEVWESILDKPIEKSAGYVHKLPFILNKDTTLNIHMKDKFNKVVILIVNESNQILFDLDIILPKDNKVLNISLGEK